MMAAHAAASLQASTSCGAERARAQPVIQRKCAACAAEDQETIHAKANDAGLQPSSAGNAAAAVRLGGRPLSQQQRSYFEPRLGIDLGAVRVHTDHQAAIASDAIGARAYTLGDHVAFAAGAFAPDTPGGQRLLAHELAHVRQQRGGTDQIQRWSSCSEATLAGTDCPAREAGEAARAKAAMVFFSELHDPDTGASGSLVANFDFGSARVKPGLASTIYWRQFLRLIAKEHSRWRLLGFSECHEAAGGAALRRQRAEAVRDALPPDVQAQIDGAEAASEEECMRPNTTAADRTMNRSVAFVLETSVADFSEDEDDVIVGKTPADRLRECQAGARVKTFPFRTTRFGGAPIMAHRDGGQIVVEMPMHVRYNGDFRKEVDTLPNDVFLGGASLDPMEIVKVRHYELKHWYNFNLTGDASGDEVTEYCVPAEKLLDFAHATQTAFYVNVAVTGVEALTMGTPVGKALGTGVSKLASPVVNLGKSAAQKTLLGGMLAVSDVMPSVVAGRVPAALVQDELASQAVSRAVAPAISAPLADLGSEGLASSAVPRLGSSLASDLAPRAGSTLAGEIGDRQLRSWLDYLPQARERVTAAKEKYGEHGLTMMATPTGPASQNARLITALLSQHSLNEAEMRVLARTFVEEYPVLRQLTAAQQFAGTERYKAMMDVLESFEKDAHIRLDVVPNFSVQNALGSIGDFGSTHVTPGVYSIEVAIMQDVARLSEEVTHGVTAHYIELFVGHGGSLPTLGEGLNAQFFIEETIKRGGRFPFDP